MPRKTKGYTDAHRAKDYKDVFSDPVGQRVLFDILGKAGVFAPNPHTGAMGDRAEGARALALHIGSFVVFDAKSFIDTWNKAKEDTDEI